MNAVTIGIIVVLLLAAIVGGWIYFANQEASPAESSDAGTINSQNLGGSNPTSGISTEAPDAPALGGSVEITTGAVKQFTIAGRNYSFLPAAITVKKGDTVKILFKNESGFHDLVIDKFNAKTERLNGGEEETITFVADKTGAFEYYCSVGNHRAMGMKGTLTVTP